MFWKTPLLHHAVSRSQDTIITFWWEGPAGILPGIKHEDDFLNGARHPDANALSVGLEDAGREP